MAERQFGPYRLVRQIAVGGMAEIHLAKTKGIAGFEKYVALKMIHPNFAEDEAFIQMLVDEAKIAVQLTHGNIAQTFDLGRVGDTYYITMEYVDGADLYKILRRASEVDIELPLDVCAFVGKEIASALDHAHRKRDNFGKTLGIVHRDVSPQNVLISYAGEVKLVDFGIAKATMKARQTGVGVIKGKYYYMSPEQAWGDPIDHRSDIFSAGIVLYEMITGQMLYLEEDLHRLLDMARKADIAPPSKLRKGVPPQLERIVMHALAKVAGERYQSAADFASDLERFLHTYSPVFTASKIATLLKQVIGDPTQVPDDGFPSIELRDGIASTHELEASELIIDPDDIRDENSVIFRIDELGGRRAAAGDRAPDEPTTPLKRQKLPSIPKPAAAVRPGAARPGPAPAAGPPARPTRSRQAHEETRQLERVAPAGPNDESGLLTPDGGRIEPPTTEMDPRRWEVGSTHPGHDDLDNIGERTVVTGAPGGGGFMVDLGGEDVVEATLVTAMPAGPETDAQDVASPFDDAADDQPLDEDDDGPTMSRETLTRRRAPLKGKQQPPPALAAKIHAPAVSEIRKPRPSRRTPPGGVPAQSGNVLQQIVGAQPSEPMPIPMARPHDAPPPPLPLPPPPPGSAPGHAGGPAPGYAGAPAPSAFQASVAQPPLEPPQQFPMATAPPAYGYDASGMPLGLTTPPPGTPVQPVPGVPPHLQPYLHVQGMPPGYPPGHPAYPVALGGPGGYPMAQGMAQQGMAQQGMAQQGMAQQGMAQQGMAQQGMAQQGGPQAQYQLTPYGLQQRPMSLTGQLRWAEVDELPSQYRLIEARRRWLTYVVAGILAVSVAAGVTFFIIKSTRDTTPTTGSIRITSEPRGAEVTFDGVRLGNLTPLTVDGIPLGTRHEIRIELRGYKRHDETVDVPKSPGDPLQVSAYLTKRTGRVIINCKPAGADVFINDRLRGRAPNGFDMDLEGRRKIELRLKGYEPFIVSNFEWTQDDRYNLDVSLTRSPQ